QEGGLLLLKKRSKEKNLFHLSSVACFRPEVSPRRTRRYGALAPRRVERNARLKTEPRIHLGAERVPRGRSGGITSGPAGI
ncbi:hypothetical protein GOODEAATRI_008693, partial [Goodea atripinnis]